MWQNGWTPWGSEWNNIKMSICILLKLEASNKTENPGSLSIFKAAAKCDCCLGGKTHSSWNSIRIFVPGVLVVTTGRSWWDSKDPNCILCSERLWIWAAPNDFWSCVEPKWAAFSAWILGHYQEIFWGLNHFWIIVCEINKTVRLEL